MGKNPPFVFWAGREAWWDDSRTGRGSASHTGNWDHTRGNVANLIWPTMMFNPCIFEYSCINVSFMNVFDLMQEVGWKEFLSLGYETPLGKSVTCGVMAVGWWRSLLSPPAPGSHSQLSRLSKPDWPTAIIRHSILFGSDRSPRYQDVVCRSPPLIVILFKERGKSGL